MSIWSFQGYFVMGKETKLRWMLEYRSIMYLKYNLFLNKWRDQAKAGSLSGIGDLINYSKHCLQHTQGRCAAILHFHFNRNGKKEKTKTSQRARTSLLCLMNAAMCKESFWHIRNNNLKKTDMSHLEIHSNLRGEKRKNMTKYRKKRGKNKRESKQKHCESIRGNSAGGCIHITSGLVSSKTFRAEPRKKLH